MTVAANPQGVDRAETGCHLVLRSPVRLCEVLRVMQSSKICIAATLAAWFIAAPCQTWADDENSLYQAMEVVTGTDLRERPRGFAQCLEDVLVKLSGDSRLRGDPRVIAIAEH